MNVICNYLGIPVFLGVSPALRFGVGLSAASPHLLRKLRAFRSYPSRENKVKKFVWFIRWCIVFW